MSFRIIAALLAGVALGVGGSFAAVQFFGRSADETFIAVSEAMKQPIAPPPPPEEPLNPGQGVWDASRMGDPTSYAAVLSTEIVNPDNVDLRSVLEFGCARNELAVALHHAGLPPIHSTPAQRDVPVVPAVVTVSGKPPQSVELLEWEKDVAQITKIDPHDLVQALRTSPRLDIAIGKTVLSFPMGGFYTYAFELLEKCPISKAAKPPKAPETDQPQVIIDTAPDLPPQGH